MIPELRKRFSQQWTEEQYRNFLKSLEKTAGTPVGFRCMESPVFLPKPLLDKMVRYGLELYDQIDNNPDYRQASDTAIPVEFWVPHEAPHPLFLQADFGLVEEADGSLEPKLVEIQGFPSIYAFQSELAAQYQECFRLNEILGCEVDSFLGGHSRESFRSAMSRAILNGHAPEQVVLMEIDPFGQKTAADFLATRRLLGIQIVDVMQVERRGRKLFFNDIEIKRIYNRVIIEELVKKNLQPSFRFTDDLDVEWAGHPNWFFRLSKFSLPWFRHPCVPPTWFLGERTELPESLDEYVLKPLYSFAGAGVRIGPTREEIEAIPPTHRHGYILQRKMNFVPTIETPGGPTKLEIRVMYIREGDHFSPVNTVIRTGRGKMMGVDFNRDLTWVGASAGFFPSA